MEMERLVMKFILLVVAFAFSALAFAQDEPVTPTVSSDQLEHFQFDQSQKAKPPVVAPLSEGQVFALKQDRKDVKDMIALNLGILALHGDTRDLSTIQQIIDRDILKKNQTQEWQDVGVVFGDILANQFDLHWVSYGDDKGISTALQWKDTQNFVFPVTMFSKRIQFGEELNVDALYKKITKDIEQFKAYERKLPKM